MITKDDILLNLKELKPALLKEYAVILDFNIFVKNNEI
jgi:hypothetical protein